MWEIQMSMTFVSVSRATVGQYGGFSKEVRLSKMTLAQVWSEERPTFHTSGPSFLFLKLNHLGWGGGRVIQIITINGYNYHLSVNNSKTGFGYGYAAHR